MHFEEKHGNLFHAPANFNFAHCVSRSEIPLLALHANSLLNTATPKTQVLGVLSASMQVEDTSSTLLQKGEKV